MESATSVRVPVYYKSTRQDLLFEATDTGQMVSQLERAIQNRAFARELGRAHENKCFDPTTWSACCEWRWMCSCWPSEGGRGAHGNRRVAPGMIATRLREPQRSQPSHPHERTASVPLSWRVWEAS